MNRILLKKHAKESLRGKWFRAIVISFGSAILLSVIPGIISGIASATNPDGVKFENGGLHLVNPSTSSIILLVLAGLIGLVLYGVFEYGLAKVFLRGSRGENYSIKDMFDGFKDQCGKNVLVGFMSSVFVVLWGIIPSVIGLIICSPAIVKIVNKFNEHLSAEDLAKQILSSVAILFVGLLCLMIGSILSTIAEYAYKMIYYIRVDHPELSWFECIRMSRKIMHGRKLDLYVLNLTFAGWVFVSIITCGIGFIWLVPYMNASFATFYDSIKDDFSEE